MNQITSAQLLQLTKELVTLSAPAPAAKVINSAFDAVIEMEFRSHELSEQEKLSKRNLGRIHLEMIDKLLSRRRSNVK